MSQQIYVSHHSIASHNATQGTARLQIALQAVIDAGDTPSGLRLQSLVLLERRYSSGTFTEDYRAVFTYEEPD